MVDASPSLQATQSVAITPGFRLQWEEAQGCHVLLFPEGMIQLNESAAVILQHCESAATVAELIAALQARFPEAETLPDDVMEFLQVAQEKNWVTLGEPA